MSEKSFEDMQAMGFQFYKKEEANGNTFISIPKQFYTCILYRKYLTSTTRELYAWLKDRMSLSEKTTNDGNNSYVDDNGFIYLVFTRKNVMDVLNLSKQTASDSFKILTILGLIYEKRLGQGFSNRIYIGKVKYLKEDEALTLIKNIEDSKIFQKSKKHTSENFQKSKNQTSENYTSRSLENIPLEVEKLDAINTDTTNTDFINTNLVVVDRNSPTYLKNYFEKNICELKPTTLNKFNEYINQLDPRYLEAIINYCAEINTRSFAGFNAAVKGFLENGANTIETLESYIIKFRNDKKKTKEIKRQYTKKEDTWITGSERPFDHSLERKLLGYKDNGESLDT